MTFDELKNFLLNFEHSYCEDDDQNSIVLFKINLEEMQKATENKLKNAEELSEFEINKFNSRLKKIIDLEQDPIFAILHKGNFPVRFEVKADKNLSRLLREKESVVPSKLLDQNTWNMIIGFGQISKEEAIDLINLSYQLVSEV